MYYLKISIFILLIAVCNSDSFPQTNSKESGNKPGYDYWDETVLKFKVLGTTSLHEKTPEESSHEIGYGGSVSLQFPISRPVSLYAELIIGGIKMERWESKNGVSYLKSDKVEPILFSQAGVRIYPSRKEIPLYLKTGIALPFIVYPLPVFTAGVGYDFVISDKIGIYPEVELVEIFFWNVYAIVFGLGLEIFH